jgi:heme A synthase
LAERQTKWLRWFALIAVGGVVVQSILGGEVVRRLLQYWLPVLHACFAQDHVWRDFVHGGVHQQVVD